MDPGDMSNVAHEPPPHASPELDLDALLGRLLSGLMQSVKCQECGELRMIFGDGGCLRGCDIRP